jgi:hypothetical protein
MEKTHLASEGDPAKYWKSGQRLDERSSKASVDPIKYWIARRKQGLVTCSPKGTAQFEEPQSNH